ncbi:MAG TPA: hypothetical protein VMV29_09815 [Ktedonobacterales bacterium]|nr:hypothetical protein [Ktedonobacterales bacterium]
MYEVVTLHLGACASCNRQIDLYRAIRVDALIHGEKRDTSVGGYFCSVVCVTRALEDAGRGIGRAPDAVLHTIVGVVQDSPQGE